MNDVDLSVVHLDVYVWGDGPWNPEHGEVDIPADWEFLPSGDAFVTRTVKAAGRYWVAWRPRSRNRPHRRLEGLWAPAEVVAPARAHVRHHHTGYEENLADLELAFDEEEEYRWIKRNSHTAVDDFLERHRSP